jgi:hypothetical protein
MAMEFLGTSQNKYQYQPLTRETKFEPLDNPMALTVYYEGLEKDKYDTYFGAFKQHSKQRILYKIHWFCFSYFRTRAF